MTPTKTMPDIVTIRHHHRIVDAMGEKSEYGYLIDQELVWTDDELAKMEARAQDAAEYVPCVLLVNGRPVSHYYVKPGTADIVEEDYDANPSV